MDPFHYGKPRKPGGPFPAPREPVPGSWPLPGLGGGPVSPLGGAAVGRAARGAGTISPASLPPSASSDYDTVRNGGLIFAALAFIVGLIIILSKWCPSCWRGAGWGHSASQGP